MVELTARRRSHWSLCGNVWVGTWFPDVWFHLAEKNAEKQTVFPPRAQAAIWVTVRVVDCLTEDRNGMGLVSDGRRIAW